MKFIELGGIMFTRGASLRMKGVVYKACVRSVLTYGIVHFKFDVDIRQKREVI